MHVRRCLLPPKVAAMYSRTLLTCSCYTRVAVRAKRSGTEYKVRRRARPPGAGISPVRVATLLASPGHTGGRAAVLGHAVNTLQLVITPKNLIVA